jgi:hypothetical protein
MYNFGPIFDLKNSLHKKCMSTPIITIKRQHWKKKLEKTGMTTAMPNIKFMNKYDLQESDDIVIPDENYTMV